MSRWPSTALSRSARPVRPVPAPSAVLGAAPPMPSSPTCRRRRPVPFGQLHDGAAGAAVPGHVGEQLGGGVVGDRLDGRAGRSGRSTARVAGPHCARDERGQRGFQSHVESRGMDALDDVAQLDQCLLGVAVGGVDQRQRALGVVRHAVAAFELLLGLSQFHGQRPELGLGAVVQVALDPPQMGGCVVDEPGARPLQRVTAPRSPPGRAAPGPAGRPPRPARPAPQARSRAPSLLPPEPPTPPPATCSDRARQEAARRRRAPERQGIGQPVHARAPQD